MLEGLVPVSGKHSIKRVIATIFIPQAFLKPEDVFEKVELAFSSGIRALKFHSYVQKIEIVNSKKDNSLSFLESLV